MTNPLISTTALAVLAGAVLQLGGANGALASSPEVTAQYAGLPMRFEPNVGQSDPRVRFLARGNGYTLFLSARKFVG